MCIAIHFLYILLGLTWLSQVSQKSWTIENTDNFFRIPKRKKVIVLRHEPAAVRVKKLRLLKIGTIFVNFQRERKWLCYNEVLNIFSFVVIWF